MAAPVGGEERILKSSEKTESTVDKHVTKCVVHIISVRKEARLQFTRTRWNKFLECVRIWSELDGDDKLIADVCSIYLEIPFESIPQDIGFDPTCYRRFIDKKRIDSARKRCELRLSTPETDAQSTSSAGSGTGSAHAKTLRSRYSLPVQPSGPVLPAICIVCKKKERYFTVANKRRKDHLVKSETVSAGLLQKAAQMKADQSILVHIQDKDCVALEVRYHKSCYIQYTRFLSNIPQETCQPTGSLGPLAETERFEAYQPYSKSYQVFCNNVIHRRLILNQEVLRMTKLYQIFIDVVKKQEGIDASTYRVDSLKSRLRIDYPQLSFHSPHRQNTSTIVFVETLSTGQLVGRLPSSSTSETDPDTTESADSADMAEPGDVEVTRKSQRLREQTGQHSSSRTTPAPDVGMTRDLYKTGLILKNVLTNNPGMSCPWPPTSDDFTISAAKSVVPIELYNLLAWVIGASDEPTLANYVLVPFDTDLKLLSLCQDLVYLASKGRKQTPKSLCLGLTIRHLTGSSQILSLLSKLGHCSSRNTVMSLDTSLAQLQLLEGADKIPQGFAKNVATVLVWDNIDFGEETLSGRGTTHHTNGIMIQSHINQFSLPTERKSLKRGITALKPPSTTSIDPYYQRKRQGPQNMPHDILLDADHYRQNMVPALQTELAYIVIKYMDAGLFTIPGWTGFHTNLQSDCILEKSAIHYLPVIEASPTEMSTVNTILNRSLALADRLQLETIIVVFDQAIYAKAQQIRWNDDNFKRRIVVRLGEFHTCMSFLGVIGKRFGDAGLRDILIESEVVAQGSINGVLNGHHYNRSMRAHKLLYESLHRLRFKMFLESLPQHQIDKCQEVIERIKFSVGSDEFSTLCNADEFVSMMMHYEEFVKKMSRENATFAYWTSYLEMVQTLLLFVRATRESDWELHLSAIRFMMPWVFSYDRVHYARYLPVYWLEMVNLPVTHPECHLELTARGKWTVQRQSAYGFSSVACDQAIEQTCNRDSKTKGGLTGMTLNRGAVYRWILSQPQRAAIARQCEVMAGETSDIRKRKDLDATRIKNDEVAIAGILSTIECMINPFDSPHDELVCLSSGIVATAKISSELSSAQEKGEMALMEFLNQRLISTSQDMFSPIKSLKLKTFSDQAKSLMKTKPIAGKDVILHSDKKLFARLLIIGQNRKLDLKEILSYSLGTVSYPLASADGSLAKTNKSALLHLVQSEAGDCLVHSVPENGVIVFDGMAVIQALCNIPPTFGELADTILTSIFQVAMKYKCIRLDFVTDRYPEVSIKSVERSRRAAGGKQVLKIYRKEQKTPSQWKKFLADGTNKEALVEFLFCIWKDADFKSTTDFSLYVTHGEECHCLAVQEGSLTVMPVPELNSDHEESDTRMFLHVKHASRTHETVIIRSPDTDVAVIAISLKAYLPVNLYFFTGTGNQSRIIDLQKVTSTLGPKASTSLIGLHTFTGCDSTSAFFGKGKKRAFDLASKNIEFLDAFIELGTSFTLQDTTASVLERFVCHLYGQASSSDVNDVRYKVFCLASSSLPEQTMPPTHDALYQHSKRANYQAAIMRLATTSMMNAPSPVGSGWHMEKDELSITWMTRNPAPDAVLMSVNCGCKIGKCATGRCSCKAAKLPCTDLCRCQNCENVIETTVEEAPDDDDDESDDESDLDE